MKRSSARAPRISRRELLSGRLAKLAGWASSPSPRSPQETASPDAAAEGKRPALLMRYPPAAQAPRPSPDEREAAPTPRADHPASIQGISITEVTPLPFSPAVARRGPAARPEFRPPGAIEESAFLRGCTRCGDCLQACPHQAVVLSDSTPRGEGAPTLRADAQPCLMCRDFPCISACDAGVLSMSSPKVMGTARVTPQLCLAHRGVTCTVCSERCPVDDAIHVREGRPTIDENVCTGCGVCRYVCPAPENAILLMPALSRPG